MEYKPNRWITYWFFYPFSKPYKVAQRTEVTRSRRFSLFGQHQGDWEQIAIKLKGSTPVAVAYYAHGDPKIVSWAEATEGRGDHPLVAVALGSHASYPPSYAPATGEQKEPVTEFLGGRVILIDVLDRKGDRWTTSERMRDVRREPWYGYGGAWGVPSKWWGVERIKNRRDVSTGPLGPSRWKAPAPNEWMH